MLRQMKYTLGLVVESDKELGEGQTPIWWCQVFKNWKEIVYFRIQSKQSMRLSAKEKQLYIHTNWGEGKNIKQ